MKSVFLSIFLVYGCLLSAQEIYLHPSIGYGIGFPGEPTQSVKNNGSESTNTLERIGLGGGINTAVSFGMINNDNWGFDLNLQYQQFLGKEITREYGGLDLTTSKFTSWSLRFSPSLRIEADGNRVNPFIMFGPTINYIQLIEEWESHYPSFGGGVHQGILGNKRPT